jgi:hypothetical protein
MNTYSITHEEKGQELKAIQETLKKIDYHHQIIHPK